MGRVASSHTQKGVKTNSETLLIGVLGIAVTCVHELVVFLPSSWRWRGFDIEQCAAASSEARRRSFSNYGLDDFLGFLEVSHICGHEIFPS